MADLDMLSDPDLGLDRVRKNLNNDMKDSGGAKQRVLTSAAATASASVDRDRDRDRPEDDSANGTPEKSATRTGLPDVAEEKASSGSRVTSRRSSKDGVPSSAATSSTVLARVGGSKDDVLEDGEGASRLRFDRQAAVTRADSNPAVDDKSSSGSGSGPAAAHSAAAPHLASVVSPEEGSNRGINSLLARPHHIPKMNDNLAKRMDEIRKTMGGEAGGMDAPWDSKGRPLGKMGSSMGSSMGLGSSRALGSPLGSLGDAGDKK